MKNNTHNSLFMVAYTNVLSPQATFYKKVEMAVIPLFLCDQ